MPQLRHFRRTFAQTKPISMQHFSSKIASYWGYTILFWSCLTLHANGANLVIKSSNKVFNLSINGVLQTLYPINGVVISNVPQPVCLLKIEFLKLSPIEQSLYIANEVDYLYEVVVEKERTWLQYEEEINSSKKSKLNTNGLNKIEFSIAHIDSSFYVPTPTTLYPAQTTTINPAKTDSSKLRNGASKIDEKKLAQLYKAQRIHQPCPEMTQTIYQKVLREILDTRFDVKRLKHIKKAISSYNCTVEQTIGLLELLNFERNRLDCAKFAYHYVQNYEKAPNFVALFELYNSINDFNNYLASF